MQELQTIVGEIYAEGPPVPIPNTEVKLCRADDTWVATLRDNRYSPTYKVSEFTNLVFLYMNSWYYHAEGPHVPIPNTEDLRVFS